MDTTGICRDSPGTTKKGVFSYGAHVEHRSHKYGRIGSARGMAGMARYGTPDASENSTLQSPGLLAAPDSAPAADGVAGATSGTGA